MTTQQQLNYERITEAIIYIQQHFKQQPSLDKIAEHIHLSPFHFQRLFIEWAGVSPKKFLKYISVAYAKEILKNKEATLFDASCQTGLSGTSRLHDLFIQIEGMRPGDYKKGGKNLTIHYSFVESLFGNILVASTTIGICHLAFAENEQNALTTLQANFPTAIYIKSTDAMQQQAIAFFTQNWSQPAKLKLHLKGTDFQLKVWETLLKIPLGKLTTYGDIAKEINNPNASRAVGTAIGDNPVAFLIPCHRVIKASGMLSGYRWGAIRKTAIIGWEAAQINDAN